MSGATLLTVNGATSAGTATQTSADQGIGLQQFVGLTVAVNVTALAGTSPTLLLEIDGKDPASGQYFQLHANFTTIAAPGLFVYQIAPGFSKPATGGITDGASTVPTPLFRVKVTGGGTITSASYTVGATWA